MILKSQTAKNHENTNFFSNRIQRVIWSHFVRHNQKGRMIERSLWNTCNALILSDTSGRWNNWL